MNSDPVFPEKPRDWEPNEYSKARYEATLGDIGAARDQARAWRSGYEELRRLKLQKSFESRLTEAAADRALQRLKDQKHYEQSIAEELADSALSRVYGQKEFEQDLQSASAYCSALSDLAKSGVDRARAGAERVQVAATAIGTLYAGALGLVYAAKDNPLPIVGLLPTVFLGLAIVFSTLYTSYLTKTTSVDLPPLPSAVFAAMQIRAVKLIEAANLITYNRVYWLRCSVVFLGLGMLVLPLSFLEVWRGVTAFIVLLALGLGIGFVVPRVALGVRDAR